MEYFVSTKTFLKRYDIAINASIMPFLVSIKQFDRS